MILAAMLLAGSPPQESCPLPTSWNMNTRWEDIARPFSIVAYDPELGIRLEDYGMQDAATLTGMIDLAGDSMRVIVLDTARGDCLQLIRLAQAVSAARPCTPQTCFAVAVPIASRPVPRSRKRAPIPLD